MRRMVCEKAKAAGLYCRMAAMFCFVLFCLFTVGARASDGFNEGDYTWFYEDGVLTISPNYEGSGIDDYYSDNAPWRNKVWHNTDLDTVIIEEGITSIGTFAFSDCVQLTTVSLPESLRSIHEMAFYDCPRLEKLSLSANVTDLRMPFVEYNDFTDSGSLATVQVAASNPAYKTVDGIVYSRDGSVLVYCPMNLAITSYHVPGGTKEIGSHAFSLQRHLTSIALPDGLTKIDWNAFQRTKIPTISIPKSVTELGGYVFYRSMIASVTIPAGVTSWGNRCFSGCNQLNNATVEEGVTEIPDSSFHDCPHLKRVTIPKSVQYIRNGAFDGCWALADVYYAGSETDAGNIIWGITNDCIRFSATWHYNSIPTATPVATATPEPTAVPTQVPTAAPTAVPTQVPTAVPTQAPTAVPTQVPTAVPTQKPTAVPTQAPTAVPTQKPTAVPTQAPTSVPTAKPTQAPTPTPTPKPTQAPTSVTVGGGVYKLNQKKTAAILVGPAKKTATKLTIRATVKIGKKTYKVTEIAANACKGMTKLQTVTVGKYISKIGKSAFYNCKKLKTILVKTVKIKKSGVGSACFKNISKSAVFRVEKSAWSNYRSWFVNPGNAPKTADFTLPDGSYPGVLLDAKHFPDSTFRAQVSEFDQNGDGLLEDKEIEDIRTIECLNMGISSVQGVEYLTSLDFINFAENKVKKADFSKNPVLHTVIAYNNGLTSLNVSKNKNLHVLTLGGNRLKTIKLPNAEYLGWLDLSGNLITKLDISKQPILQRLVKTVEPTHYIYWEDAEAYNWISGDDYFAIDWKVTVVANGQTLVEPAQ